MHVGTPGRIELYSADLNHNKSVMIQICGMIQFGPGSQHAQLFRFSSLLVPTWEKVSFRGLQGPRLIFSHGGKGDPNPLPMVPPCKFPKGRRADPVPLPPPNSSGFLPFWCLNGKPHIRQATAHPTSYHDWAAWDRGVIKKDLPTIELHTAHSTSRWISWISWNSNYFFKTFLLFVTKSKKVKTN